MSTDRMKVKECQIDPELWLDYVEDELEGSLQEDLTLHVEQCRTCRGNLREFQQIRNNIKTPSFKLPDELTFKRLENKIMEGVGKTYIESSIYTWQGQTKKIAFTGAAVFVVVFGTYFANPFRQHKVVTGTARVHDAGVEEQFIAQTAANDPEFFNDVIMSHQDSDDMVLEAAAHKLSNMSDTEARTVLDGLN